MCGQFCCFIKVFSMFQVKFKEKVDIEDLVFPSKATGTYFKHGHYGHKRRTFRANEQYHVNS